MVAVLVVAVVDVAFGEAIVGQADRKGRLQRASGSQFRRLRLADAIEGVH